MAKMFVGNSTVVGFDLRNEQHTPAGDTYAQGATRGTGIRPRDDGTDASGLTWASTSYALPG
jgi:hypothetical protein